jgi:Protein of unknown function (DUF2568)
MSTPTSPPPSTPPNMPPNTPPSTPSAGGPSLLVTLVLGVRFLTELALIAAAAWAGAARTRSIPLAVALGVVAAVVVAAIWSSWIAPASRRRLADPSRLVLELLLFAAAAAGLVVAGRPVVAAVVGVLGGAAAVAVRFLPGGEPLPRTQQPAEEPAPEDAGSSEAAPGEPAPPAIGHGSPPLRRPRGRDRARPSR